MFWCSQNKFKHKKNIQTNTKFQFQVLVEQGLGKYCDPDFVRFTSNEMQEALDMTKEEMDLTAHQILQQEQRLRQNINSPISTDQRNPSYQPQQINIDVTDPHLKL